MSRARLLLLGLLLLSGCRGGPVVQETDRILIDLATRPIDPAPRQSTENKPNTEQRAGSVSDGKASDGKASAAHASGSLPNEPEADIQTVAFLQADKQVRQRPKYELAIPAGLPGSEAAPLPSLGDLRKMTPEQRQRIVQRLYPALPPLPEEPVPQPGPNGQKYTLADLQKLAVENSPILRQAVADVKGAEGALVQAKTYQNPTIAYQASPTNNNSNAGAQGGYIEQPLRMWGKMKLAVAAAKKDLDNAQLALRRARFDLSTSVRNAYFALIVAQETMRVNRALVRLSDEIYRVYTEYLAATMVAPYEPAPLRAQAFTNRLAYKQATYSYISAWKQLVTILGLHQLPLTEVSGRVDRLIPYYDYDKVLAHVLANHTDVLTASNGVEKAKYNLQLARITPLPDVDLLAAVWKESTIVPYVIFYQAQVVMPIPVWDRNKGNIFSAQAALVRAVEESHRVENALTNNLAANFANYQSNLKALEYYRRYILPDQVLYYRGVFERREVDQNTSSADLLNNLATAQQTLATNVQNYLGILGSLWSAVVSVADLMQTPDLFQLGTARELPELPKLDQMPRWLCPHHRLTEASAACAAGGPVKPAEPPAGGQPVLPAPRQLPEPPPDVPKKSKDEGTIESEPRP